MCGAETALLVAGAAGCGPADQYAATRPPRAIARAFTGSSFRLAFKPTDVRRHAQSLTDVACRCDGRQRNGETESQNKEKKNKPRGHNALTDKVTPFGQSLRWRSQFTPQPACCFKRFYRIDKLDHADERDRKRGIRMFGCQSRTCRGCSVPASSSFCTSGMLVRKTRS